MSPHVSFSVFCGVILKGRSLESTKKDITIYIHQLGEQENRQKFNVPHILLQLIFLFPSRNVSDFENLRSFWFVSVQIFIYENLI